MKTRRLLVLTLAVALAFSFTFATVAFANEPAPIGVTVDGERVVFEDQQPTIVDGRTLVPVRGVFEFMGFEVDWDPDARTAMLVSDDYEVIITADEATFTTNGVSHTLDVPAQIINDRTMLPIRAVLESVGYNVYWDNANRTVIVLSMSAMDLLLQSNAAMAEVTSYESVIEMTMVMTAEGMTMNTSITGESATHVDPIAMGMSMTTVMNIPGMDAIEMDMETYIIHEGDYLIMYMYVEGEWSKMTMPFSQELLDELMLLSTSDAMADLYTSAVIVGSERIGGVDTWRVDFEMDIAAAMGYLGGLTTGFDELMPMDIFDGMDNVVATVWIAKDSLYQVRIHMDLAEVMADMMAEMGVTLTTYVMTITSTNFNNARPVVLPEAAADAVEIELPQL